MNLVIRCQTQLASSLQFLNGENKIWDVVEGPASVEASKSKPRQGGKPLDCSKPGKSEATATAKTKSRAVDRVTWEETRAAIRLSAAKDSGESDRGDKGIFLVVEDELSKSEPECRLFSRVLNIEATPWLCDVIVTPQQAAKYKDG
ncbi:hypothetical protein K0M31_012158 [Melipona bicolor]|uniref:Uncharacterized protein n=1 Tax=Melipona bicolor TaxID=60889 RepID=A0AA40FK18_9HYME|nr:hypothetical protein K0M31_012158 [Melipona bicolor]